MLSRSFMTPQTSKSLLAYTPMFHGRMFGETAKFRDKMFQPLRTSLATHPDPETPPVYKDSDLYLDGNPTFDRPLFVQFCANNPNELLESARYVAPFCDAVDLNLGCPQGIARTGRYGAFLQEDQDLIYSIINKLHNELSVPITAKIRILETKEKTLAYAKNVLSAGASILTVHGRQREAKGHKTGLADWTVIRYLRENLPKETVLFANGNILRHEDIDHCLEQTGVDGVMSAEGNLHDPSIFGEAPAEGKEGREFWRGKDGKGGWRMDAAFRRYMDIMYKHVLNVPCPDRKPLFLATDSPVAESFEENEEDDGQPPRKKQRKSGKVERTTNPNLVAMQPHLFRMLRPLVSKHHNVRDALARCKAGDIAAFENVLQLVELAVKQGLQEYDATNGKSIEDYYNEDQRMKESENTDVTAALKGNEEYESSVEMVKACKRPWWVCQPYVRPLPIEAIAKGSLTLSRKELAKLNGTTVQKANGVKKISKDIAEKPVDSLVPKTEKEVVDGDVVEVPKNGMLCG